MADDAEVCGCNGVCKGTIVKAIKEKGLFTLDDVRKHTKASALVRLVHRPGRADPDVHRRRRLLGRAEEEADVRLHRPQPPGSARRDHRRAAPADHPRRHAGSWTGARRNGCALLPPGAQLLPALHLAQARPATIRRSRFINERAHANIQKDGTYSVIPRMWGGETTPSELRAHRRRRRQVQDPDGEGHRRPAHRPARREEGRPAGGLGRPQRHRHALGPRLRQGAAHGEDLRRLRMVPLRHAGFDAAGPRTRARAVGACTRRTR